MAFTVHGMDQELEVKLTQRAKREGISRNQLAKQLLARAMGYSDMTAPSRLTIITGPLEAV